VVVELIGCGARYGFDEREIPGRLAAHGFRACGYHPFDRRLTARSDGVRPGNGLFVRDIDWARARVAGAPPVDVFGLRV
jgi:hypothetical protein